MKFTGLFVLLQALVLIEGSGQGCITSVMIASNTASDCSEWASANSITTGIHEVTIDPDGAGTEFSEVTVVCDLDSQPGKICTVINHDQEDKTLIDGFEDPFSYRVQLNYDIGLDTAKRIADDSTECKQYIKYDCFHSVLFYGAWENRFMQNSTYFTGDGTGNNYCECPSPCSLPNGCNCDKNDAVWRFDEGYVTDKDDLPITAFNAGDTGIYPGNIDEKAFRTIGPLVCC